MRLFVFSALAAATIVAATAIGATTDATAAVRCKAPGVHRGCVMHRAARAPLGRPGDAFNSFNSFDLPSGSVGPVTQDYQWPPSGGRP
jgi:hypothetical protein